MKRIVLAVLVVVVGLFAVRRFTGFPSGRGKKEVDVQVTMQGGVCAVKSPVDELGGAWKNKVRWNATNVDCDASQYVTFLEYRARNESGLSEPEHIVDPDPASSRQLARGSSDRVDAKIDKFNWNPFGDKVYKYKICVGPSPNPSTNCLDPDVDVWPF
jgi:hypothetical protein